MAPKNFSPLLQAAQLVRRTPFPTWPRDLLGPTSSWLQKRSPPNMESQLLDNARNYSPCNYNSESVSIWHRLPVARRSAVFVLLFLGQLGELRVVLTKRSSQLRNFPGHISLPGGKADSGLESPWMVSRRETSEEIGLSENNDVLLQNYGFSIDSVTELPCYLSRTFSAVKPCVGFMNLPDGQSEQRLLHDLKLKVNPGESSSIFSCPLKDFLYPAAETEAREALDRTHYTIKWGGIPWNLRSYTFPQYNPNEVHWLQGFEDLSGSEDDSANESTKRHQTGRNADSSWGKSGARRDSVTNEKIYDVWGLTANILHDLAEVVYQGARPKKQYGEEELIWSIWNFGGQMRQKERSEIESELIRASPSDKVSFGDLLPRTEFNRLKRIYKM